MQSAEVEDKGSESEVDGEGDEESAESDDDDSIKSVADLKKLVPCTLEEFAKVSFLLVVKPWKIMAFDDSYVFLALFILSSRK